MTQMGEDNDQRPASGESPGTFWQQQRSAVVFVFAWFIVICGLIALGSIRHIADDAYYYLEIARNIASGVGSTFDRVDPTNGYHPLWAILLLPVFELFPDLSQASKIYALLLSAFFVAATGVVLLLIGYNGRRPRAGFVAAQVWLLNPFTLVVCFRGLEGPLSAFSIALCLHYLFRHEIDPLRSHRQSVTLGLLCGIAILARTDNVLLLATLIITIAWQYRNRRPSLNQALTKGTSFLVSVFIPLLPWVIWNLATFGDLQQASQQAKTKFMLWGQLPPLLPTGASGLNDIALAVPNIADNLWRSIRAIGAATAGEQFKPIERGYYLLALSSVYVLANITFPYIFGTGIRRSAGSLAKLVLPIGVLFVLHFAAYALIFRNYYIWYAFPPILMVSIFVMVSFSFLDSCRQRTWRFWSATHLLLLFSCSVLFIRIDAPESWATIEKKISWRARATVTFLKSRDATTAGAWTAGSHGYYFHREFPGGRLVNLDGVVNNRVASMLTVDEYLEYLINEIQFVTESPQIPNLWGHDGFRRAIRRYDWVPIRFRRNTYYQFLPPQEPPECPAARRVVRGKVHGPSGASIPSATVTVAGREGTLERLAVDSRGRFCGALPENETVYLRVSSAGFKNTRVPLGNTADEDSTFVLVPMMRAGGLFRSREGTAVVLVSLMNARGGETIEMYPDGWSARVYEDRLGGVGLGEIPTNKIPRGGHPFVVFANVNEGAVRFQFLQRPNHCHMKPLNEYSVTPDEITVFEGFCSYE